jgi:hypothetical protein
MSGGFGYSESRSRSSSKTKDITPEEFTGLRRPFADSLRGFLSAEGGQYPGELVAPITGDELGAIAGIGDTFDRFLASYQPGLEATARGDFLRDVPNNPFLGGAIDFIRRSVNDAFDAESASRRALFSRAGQVIQESSPFSESQSRLEVDRQDRLASQIAGAALPLYEAERQRQFGAADQAKAVLEASRGVLEAKALPRLIADLGVERGQALFTERLNRLLALFGVLDSATFKTGQFAGSKSLSFGMNASGGICWVAEVLFGASDARTHAARRWCAAHPRHWFVRLYRRFGRTWARLLAGPARWAQPLARPLWELLARRGAALAAG